MAEEANEVESKDNTVIEKTEPEYTAVEQKALDMGWRPQEEFDGPAENWRSAELFVALDPFIKRIETQSKEIKNVRKAAADTAALFNKVRETEYNNALKALRQEKKNVLENGGDNAADRLVSIDEQIDELRDNKPQPQEVESPAEPHPEFVRWSHENSWYTTDRDMAAWADGIAPRLKAEGFSPSEILSKLSKDVKEKFPNKFRNPNRDRPSSVEGRGEQAATKNTANKLKSNMTKEERSIMDNIVSQVPGMTEEKYLAQYAVVADR